MACALQRDREFGENFHFHLSQNLSDLENDKPCQAIARVMSNEICSTCEKMMMNPVWYFKRWNMIISLATQIKYRKISFYAIRSTETEDARYCLSNTTNNSPVPISKINFIDLNFDNTSWRMCKHVDSILASSLRRAIHGDSFKMLYRVLFAQY